MTKKDISFHRAFKRKIAGGLVLVHFGTPWSASCRMQTPIIAHLSKQYSGRIQIIELNVDLCQETAAALGIKSIPTLTLFRDGKEIQRFIGLHPEEMLCAAIERVMA